MLLREGQEEGQAVIWATEEPGAGILQHPAQAEEEEGHHTPSKGIVSEEPGAGLVFTEKDQTGQAAPLPEGILRVGHTGHISKGRLYPKPPQEPLPPSQVDLEEEPGQPIETWRQFRGPPVQ